MGTLCNRESQFCFLEKMTTAALMGGRFCICMNISCSSGSRCSSAYEVYIRKYVLVAKINEYAIMEGE